MLSLLEYVHCSGYFVNVYSTGQPIRRAPQQARSKQRVDLIVEATRRLVGQRGSDAVSVREIAAEAGVSVGSLYQYFPDKNAILRRLIRAYIDRIQLELARVLAEVTGPQDLLVAVDAAIDAVAGLIADDPSVATIWASVQANTVLRELDYQDAREMAEYLAAFLSEVLPAAPNEALFDTCLFTAHTVPYVLRLAYDAPADDARRMVSEIKGVLRLRIQQLAASSERGG